MFTLYEKWCSLKRGDIIKIEGVKEESIVSHVIGYDNFLVVTFNHDYGVLFKHELEIKDFEIVGFYLLPKCKEIELSAR